MRTRNEAKKGEADNAPCVLDLHPDRPIARAIAPGGKLLGRLPPDPTFDQIEELGGIVDKHDDGHTVAHGTIWVSGEIPRVTEFEQGLPGAVRWTQSADSSYEWAPEEVGTDVNRLSLLRLIQ